MKITINMKQQYARKSNNFKTGFNLFATKTNLKTATLGIALVFLGLGQVQAQELLTNGSMNRAAGDAVGRAPDNWDMDTSTTDVSQPGVNGPHVGRPQFIHAAAASPSSDGGQALAMAVGNLATPSPLIEGIRQNVSVVAGKIYELEYEFANFGLLLPSANINGINSGRLHFYLNNILVASSSIRSLGPGWVKEVVTFTASTTNPTAPFRVTVTSVAFLGSLAYLTVDGLSLKECTTCCTAGETAPQF